jgi:hypothetical protein
MNSNHTNESWHPATMMASFPPIGSKQEADAFAQLQEAFPAQFESAFPDRMAAKTVVIIPSLTLDQEILQKVAGVTHYEERLLCLLMLLRMPRTHVVYVTSMPVDPVIIDYYLHLLPGVTGYHSRQRLTLLSCYDASHISLTEKILDRPRMIKRIRESIPQGHLAHLAFFNVTEKERSLAVRLQLPVYGCDPDLFYLGNKSNSRKIFKECGLQVPDGMEDVFTADQLVAGLMHIYHKNPAVTKAVVKLNDGFSGDGNAVFYYPEHAAGKKLGINDVHASLPDNLHMVATELDYVAFMQKLLKMGGIVEAFVEGETKLSPSVQCRITPLGKCEVISTHDQVLGGESGQVFLGAHFPANAEYAGYLGNECLRVTEALKHHGVLGRFGIDFISVKNGSDWDHYAIEINLRKGGTTHPFLMLTFLTDGRYNTETGEYLTANGQPRYYYCSDNLCDHSYRGLTPHDLIDIAMLNDLQYDGSTQEGIMFHLIGALSEFGKLGVICIGATRQKAQAYYEKICQVLEWECRM